MRKIIGIVICTLIVTTTFSVVGTLNDETIPNDPIFIDQWWLHNTGQNDGTADADIDAPEAWEISIGSNEIIIAVIDSGIDHTHPDLIDNIWVNQDEIPNNGIDDDSNGYIDDYNGFNFKIDYPLLLDQHGHGTVIAGVIGAVTNNDLGVAGLCWDCKIMPLKFWNIDVRNEVYADRIDNIIEAIEYAADNGAHVISMSFGAVEEFFTIEEFIQLEDAIDYAYSNGCVLVAAALNDDSSNPYYPAAWNNVIGVAGTDHNDNRMEYQYPNHGQIVISNYGEWVDVAAPGEEIFTTSPTYDCVLTDLGRDHDYTLMSGTSLAAPIVSGLAGLILSRNPFLSPEEVMNIIKTNVDPYESAYDLGTGRVNAYKALLAANRIPTTPSFDGPSEGIIGEQQDFIIESSDPEYDDVIYFIDWGDGNEEASFGPFTSGEEQTISHTWSEDGEYEIKVKAQDEFGAESEYSTLEISMPKYKSNFNPFLRFLENHPRLFPILRLLLT